LFATEGTAKAIAEFGLRVNQIPKKIDEGHPNVLDVIQNGSVGAVINTITRDRETLQDGFLIRRAAVEKRIPCFTSIDTARAALSILSQDSGIYNVSSITGYRAD
jgi:carbamoyl-phosphate synthase large subunit